MTRSEEPPRAATTVHGPTSRLVEASIRIGRSLDVEEALTATARVASETTGRICFATAVDDAREPALSEIGPRSDASRTMRSALSGEEFSEHLKTLDRPVRIADFAGYCRSRGLPDPGPDAAAGEALLVPFAFGGATVGAILSAGAQGERELDPVLEDALVVLGSIAASAISAIRSRRSELSAKAGMETLIRTSPVGVAVLDAATGTPVSFNREAARLLLRTIEGPRKSGFEIDELLGTVVYRRTDGREVHVGSRSFVEDLREAGAAKDEEVAIRSAGGGEIAALVNVAPVHSESGVESVVVTLRDMSRLREQEGLQSEFLGIVSHELRTPLAAVKGSVTTLIEEAHDLDPAETAQFHRIIDSQVNHMRDLIGDLLDVARIAAGTLSVKPEPIDVIALVDEATRGFGGEASTSRVVVEIAADLPMVMADRRRIGQVLSNLLLNASKFSPPGAPVALKARRSGFFVEVSVDDRGAGFRADQLPRLFDKFSRAGQGDRRDASDGPGLGLAICKGLVEAHGGRIWARSEGPGKGSRFSFTLPQCEETSTDPCATPGVSAVRRRDARHREIRVLAVDDDPEALRNIRDVLGRYGFVPVVTGDPKDVLRLLHEKEPHLMLLDLMMPGADGMQLMEAVRGVADLPVIFLSAYNQEDLVAKAFDLGAVDYVVKPFSPTELSARIRSALRRTPFAASLVDEGSFTLRDLAIDYRGRVATLAGRRLNLTAIEYRLLVELSANAGRVLTHDHLLERVWGLGNNGDLRPMRSVIKKLRRALGDDARDPSYIFTEPRVGYFMAKGDR